MIWLGRNPDSTPPHPLSRPPLAGAWGGLASNQHECAKSSAPGPPQSRGRVSLFSTRAFQNIVGVTLWSPGPPKALEGLHVATPGPPEPRKDCMISPLLFCLSWRSRQSRSLPLGAQLIKDSRACKCARRKGHPPALGPRERHRAPMAPDRPSCPQLVPNIFRPTIIRGKK